MKFESGRPGKGFWLCSRCLITWHSRRNISQILWCVSLVIEGWKRHIKYKGVSGLLLIQRVKVKVSPLPWSELFWRELTGFSCLTRRRKTGVDGADLKAWNMSSRRTSEHQETTTPLSHPPNGIYVGWELKRGNRRWWSMKVYGKQRHWEKCWLDDQWCSNWTSSSPRLLWHNCFTVYSLKIFFLFVCNLWGFFSLCAVKKSWTSSPLNTVCFTGVATLVKAVKQESNH